MSLFFALLPPFITFCLLTFALGRIADQSIAGRGSIPAWPVTHACGVFLAMMLAMFVSHDLYFGSDGPSYGMLFTSYCSGWRGSEFNHEYLLSFGILNVLMVGSCSIDAMVFAWTAAIALPLTLLRTDTATKIRFAAIFFASLTAFDMSTNAMRQGIAVTVLTAALSQYPKRKILTAVGCAIALALHASSGLVLGAFALSTLPARFYYPALVVVGGILSISFLSGNQLIMGTRLYYEITKYVSHEGAEIYVRALAYTSLFIPLGVMRLLRLEKAPNFHRAFLIAMTALPLVAVPYFSYRYIYGIFPIVLWYAINAAREDPIKYRRFVIITLLMEMSLLLFWSLASSNIRGIDFIA